MKCVTTRLCNAIFEENATARLKLASRILQYATVFSPIVLGSVSFVNAVVCQSLAALLCAVPLLAIGFMKSVKDAQAFFLSQIDGLEIKIEDTNRPPQTLKIAATRSDNTTAPLHHDLWTVTCSSPDSSISDIELSEIEKVLHTNLEALVLRSCDPEHRGRYLSEKFAAESTGLFTQSCAELLQVSDAMKISVRHERPDFSDELQTSLQRILPRKNFRR